MNAQRVLGNQDPFCIRASALVCAPGGVVPGEQLPLRPRVAAPSPPDHCPCVFVPQRVRAPARSCLCALVRRVFGFPSDRCLCVSIRGCPHCRSSEVAHLVTHSELSACLLFPCALGSALRLVRYRARCCSRRRISRFRRLPPTHSHRMTALSRLPAAHLRRKRPSKWSQRPIVNGLRAHFSEMPSRLFGVCGRKAPFCAESLFTIGLRDHLEAGALR